MQRELDRLSNQARFIMMIIDQKLNISKKKKAVLIAELQKLNFKPFAKVEDATKDGETEAVVENDADSEEDLQLGSNSYDYLLGMPLWSLTLERVEKLQRQIGDKEVEIDTLIKKSRKDLWKTDLDDFIAEWRFQLEDERLRQKNIIKGRRGSKKFKIAPPVKKRKGLGDDSDDDFDEPKTKKQQLAVSSKQSKLPFAARATVPKKKVVQSVIPSSKQGKGFSQLMQRYDGAADDANSDSEMPDEDDIVEVMPKKDRSAPITKSTSQEDDNDLEMLDHDDVAEIMTKKDKAAPKGKLAATKATVPSADKVKLAAEAKVTKAKAVRDESDIEEVVVKPAGRQARTATKKPIKYEVSDDSDSGNGDDLLGDVSNMVKGLPTTGGDSRSFFSASVSRPGSSAGFKTASRAASRVADELSADETDYTKLVPQQSPRRSILITEKNRNISDDEDEDDLPLKPLSVKPRQAPKSTAAATKPAKKPAKKVESAPKIQSPAAKAYAKRLAKKKVVDSDDDVDNMADRLLESAASASEEDGPAVKATGRPARRAVATTKKVKYVVDDDSDDMHSEAESSANFYGSD